VETKKLASEYSNKDIGERPKTARLAWLEKGQFQALQHRAICAGV